MRPGRGGPGTGHSIRAAPGTSAGFNEAGARWPRNLASYGPVDEDAHDASMRPGRGGPGTATAAGDPPPTPGSFNEAGARWPRNRSCRPRNRRRRNAGRASMRPGRGGPGTIGTISYPHSHDAASMRPGRGGPGTAAVLQAEGPPPHSCFNEAGARWPRNPAPETAGAERRQASMRPGRGGAGTPRAHGAVPRAATELQ